MNLRNLLASKIHQAMITVGIPPECQPHVTPGSRPEFGDYQANGAMAAAKIMKTNPRQLAQQVVDAADLHNIAKRLEIAGPGFINIHINPEWLAETMQQANQDPWLGIVRNPQPQIVVVDYSGPNLAKEMHVGHLRSTIIGDAMARILEFRGDKVIRQNHMGDWGTQFGMLIAHLEATLESPDTLPEVALEDLEAFYRAAKKRFDDDPGFAGKARDYVVKLQAGDARCLQLWQQFITISIAHSEEIYRALNVSLQAGDIRAESAYNPQLPEILSALQQQHLATTSEGAQVVFLEELADKEGKPQAVIVQKSDGGYLYATTDLAAARYRSQTLHADRILYFIDARQSLHMQQVFAISRKAGFVADNCQLEHHPFGTMMGEDGKPFKTRTGGTVKLAELLREAVDRARHLLEQRETALEESEKNTVARKVGIGAVKYADLSKNRTSDYIFSWNAMLSFEGNTAPYLQYAYTRVQSIFRKGDINPEQLSGKVELLEPQEKILALKLLQFAEALDQVARDAYPNTLCAYLYELAGGYMRFYETCPVLQSGLPDGTRQSRLVLCDLTAKILRQGLELLGIEVMDRM